MGLFLEWATAGAITSSLTRTWGRVGNLDHLFWFRGPLPSSSGPADPEGHQEILGGLLVPTLLEAGQRIPCRFLTSNHSYAPKTKAGPHSPVLPWNPSTGLGTTPTPRQLQAKFSSCRGAFRPRARQKAPAKAWPLRKGLLGLILPVSAVIPKLPNPDGPGGSPVRSQKTQTGGWRRPECREVGRSEPMGRLLLTGQSRGDSCGDTRLSNAGKNSGPLPRAPHPGPMGGLRLRAQASPAAPPRL